MPPGGAASSVGVRWGRLAEAVCAVCGAAPSPSAMTRGALLVSGGAEHGRLQSDVRLLDAVVVVRVDADDDEAALAEPTPPF